MFQKITLNHIRPYQHVSVDLEPGMNVLFGPNGAGKTTLLEALCVLSTTKSYRAQKLFDLVSRAQPIGQICGETTNFDTLKIDILPKKHIFYKNGDRITRTSNFLHSTKITVLAPEHLHLISGSGERRRQFLDQLLCQKTPTLLDVFKSYRKTIKQKQALLKQNLSFGDYQTQVEPWNQNIVECGEEIRKQRKNILQQLHPEVECQYQEISQNTDSVHLPYFQKEESVQESLSVLGFQEYKIKRVLVGPHRDDFGIMLAGQKADVVASQGERASILLALKFSEMNFLTDERLPVLLLDDVGVTLDDQRLGQLFQRIEKLQPQTLMTTPNPAIVENAKNIGAKILTTKKEEFLGTTVWK